MERIYLDYNATTAIAPEVVDATLSYLREHFGNPSSSPCTQNEPGRRSMKRARR